MIGFRICERFDPGSGQTWINYLKWSGLAHFNEVVGLDCSLCPSVISELSSVDRDHIVYAEHLFAVFDDQRYLLSRCPLTERSQLLAVSREASVDDVHAFQPKGFTFKGYDLIEEATCISALTNCGGFERVFSPRELSNEGLIRDHKRAYTVRDLLHNEYPDEPHADCQVWAIWRNEGGYHAVGADR
jgi:hypothetical protein